jgi:acetyltransferase EpsM
VTDRVVIWGASGHALVVADILRQQGDYEIAGFLDDVDRARHGESFGGARVLGGGETLAGLQSDGVSGVVVAIGDCATRLRLGAVAREHGLELVRAIHPRAVVAPGVVIGAGTVICAGAVVNPGAALGESVIVNTAASVDHECALADGAHVGPGAHLGGRVRVGRGAWVGIGAVIADRVQIGEGSVVGAGSVVLRDVPAGVVAYGVPARVVRDI